VVSLYDLMKKFDLLNFAILVGRINHAIVLCRDKKDEGVTSVSDKDLVSYSAIAHDMGEICEQIGFEDSKYKASSLLTRLSHRPNPAHYSGVHIEMMHLHESLILDMRRHKFLQMEKGEFFNNQNLLGSEVWEAFPKSQEDILDAGNCLAVDLNTAAVFHLMHVVEWGLRALCIDLNMPDIVDDRKANRTIPIEYAMWEKILGQLPAAVDTRVQSIQDREKKQAAQTFYYPALKELAGFKDAWRNHVMHTRASYNSEDALAVKSHVERFMRSLVKHRIGEAI
jgi:hypothetical protein